MLDPKETQTDKFLNASSEMLNQMGVYQHHDAIAGTAHQLVADDYANRLSRAIEQNNNDLYTELIDK